MRKTLLGLAATLLLTSACAPPPPMEPPAPPPPEGGPPAADACGAARYQGYVGRPLSSLPPPPPGETRRVACNTCPVTMDYSERRLNVFYDERTQTITQIRCG
jgi:hypothetical protein